MVHTKSSNAAITKYFTNITYSALLYRAILHKGRFGVCNIIMGPYNMTCLLRY